MRQMLGEKKLQKLRRQTGLPIVQAFVRGNTNHRCDLLVEGGRVVHLYGNGTLEEDPEMKWKPIQTPETKDQP